MITLKGKYNKANIYTNNIDKKAVGQIIELCNQEAFKDSKIAIMPDVHAGAGCTIGTTMTIIDKVSPVMVGVDIGCGMETVQIAEKEINFAKLDCIIREYIPSGFSIREKEHKYSKQINLWNLKCISGINKERALYSIGTLGGGNHFIEVNKNKKGDLYIVVHSGSRNLGVSVAKFYQKIADNKNTDDGFRHQKIQLIDRLKKEGRQSEIQSELNKIKTNSNKVTNSNKGNISYLEGVDLMDYLHDIKIVQKFASLNRQAIIEEIVERMGFNIVKRFSTIHNYIDLNSRILRKGAISAQIGEEVLIPLNMSDGSIIGRGKGNKDWNYSAPHGAGRVLSRGQAKEQLSIEEYNKRMLGVWSTCINKSTLDESPMAYKPMQEIIDNIKDTVDILEIITPIYNFKSN